VSAGKRSTAFGLFDTAFGVAWFLGSAALGLLYDRSVPALIALSVTLQLLSLPMFLRGRARAKAVGR
jgi:predicted MFS family arabinose efflux permease